MSAFGLMAGARDRLPSRVELERLAAPAPSGCPGVTDGRPCSTSPVYLLRVRACVACWALALRRCAGHRACPAHALAAREGTLRSSVDGELVVAEAVEWPPR